MDSPPAKTSPDPDSSGGSESGGDSHFHGLARHSLIYAAGMLIGRAVSFVMLPIYTRYLTPADYGVLSLVEMTLDFIAIMAGAKIAMGVFRYYHKANTREERERIVATSFLLVASTYTLVGLAAFVLAPYLAQLIFGSPDNAILFRVAAANLAATGLVVVPLAFARVEDRSLLFVGVNLAKLLLLVGLNLLTVVVFGMGVLGVFISSLIGNALAGIALSIWIFRRVRPQFDWTAARPLLRFGLPLIGMQFATWVATFSDRFFLQAAGGEAVVGLYNLAYQFGFLMVMVGYSPIEQIWGPRRFKVAEGHSANDVLARIFVIFSAVIFIVGMSILILVDDVLRIMAAPEFRDAALYVPPILIAYVFHVWSKIHDIGVLMSERTEYLVVANVAATVVALVGYWLLIPQFLAWGAAWATAASLFTRFFLTYIFSQRLWAVEYRWFPIIVLVLWSSAVCAVNIILPEMKVSWSLVSGIILIMMYCGGLWCLPVLDTRDRAAVRGFLKEACSHWGRKTGWARRGS